MGTKKTTYLIGVFGGLMFFAGGVLIASGWDMVLNERGWTQVISGAVISSSGGIIVALSYISFLLQEIQKGLFSHSSFKEQKNENLGSSDTALKTILTKEHSHREKTNQENSFNNDTSSQKTNSFLKKILEVPKVQENFKEERTSPVIPKKRIVWGKDSLSISSFGSEIFNQSTHAVNNDDDDVLTLSLQKTITEAADSLKTHQESTVLYASSSEPTVSKKNPSKSFKSKFKKEVELDVSQNLIRERLPHISQIIEPKEVKEEEEETEDFFHQEAKMLSADVSEDGVQEDVLNIVNDAVVSQNPSEKSIIGHYTVGATAYTIYEDGSIEAEVNQNKYNFSSFEEFKAFLNKKKK